VGLANPNGLTLNVDLSQVVVVELFAVEVRMEAHVIDI
jgi:hypothetical protein